MSTALWCSVMPSVQQIIARGAVAKAWASSRIASAGTPGLALGVLERVRLDLGLVGVEVDRRALDELAVLEPGGDDLARHRVGERDVAADVEARASRPPTRR